MVCILTALVLWTLLSEVTSPMIDATWGSSSRAETGRTSVITSGFSPSTAHPPTYNNTPALLQPSIWVFSTYAFATFSYLKSISNPNLILGIVNFGLPASNPSIYFFNVIKGSTYPTYAQIYYYYNSTNLIQTVALSYFLWNSEYIFALTEISVNFIPTFVCSLTTATGDRLQTFLMSYKTTNSSHDYKWLAWFRGLSAEGNPIIDIGMTVTNLTTTTLQVTLTVRGNTKLYLARVIVLQVDNSPELSSYFYYFDFGSIEGTSNVQTSPSPPLSSTFINLMIFGVSQLSLSLSSMGVVALSNNYPYNIISPSNFNSVRYSFMNLRTRLCNSPTYLKFNPSDQKCYDECPQTTFLLAANLVTVNTSYCASCPASCQTCASSTFCMTCKPSAKPGYYNTTLKECVECADVCKTCNATGCITCIILPALDLQVQDCICPVGLGFNGSILCIACPTLILGCQTCLNNTFCRSCTARYFTLNSNNLCECAVRYTLSPNGTACINCFDVIPNCLSCRNGICSKCDASMFFILNSAINKCECQEGFYIQSGVCTPCDDMCFGCTTAGQSSCTSCVADNFRVLNGTECICIDGFVPCDGTNCDQKACIMSVNLTGTLRSLDKNTEQNQLILTIDINQYLQLPSSIDFSKAIDLGLPAGTQMECSYSNGTLTVRATYALNLQGLQTALTVDMSKIGNSFFGVQPFTMKYTVIPADNLAANVYSAATYASVKPLTAASYCVVGLAFVVFLAGLHSSKVVVTEMMGVVQLAFFGLFVLDGTDPLLTSLAPLRFSNGYNDILGALGTEALDSAALQASSRIRAAGFSASVLRNFNTTLALAVLPLLVALVLFLMSKQQHRRNRKALDSLSKNVLGQWTMLALLFGLLNFASSLGVFCQLGRPSGWAFYGDVVAAVLFAAMLAANLALYATTDFNVFGEFKYYFAWGDFESRFYFVHCAFRLAAGMLLGLGNSSYISGAAVLLLLMVVALVVSAKQPYADLPQNIRCLVNLVVSVVIMAFYTAMSAYGPSRTPTSFYVQIPVVIVGLLLAVVVMAAGFVVKEIVKEIKTFKQMNRISNQLLKEEESRQEEFIQQQLQDSKQNVKQTMKRFLNKNKQKKAPVKELENCLDSNEPNRDNGLNYERFMEVDGMLKQGLV